MSFPYVLFPHAGLSVCVRSSFRKLHFFISLGFIGFFLLNILQPAHQPTPHVLFPEIVKTTTWTVCTLYICISIVYIIIYTRYWYTCGTHHIIRKRVLRQGPWQTDSSSIGFRHKCKLAISRCLCCFPTQPMTMRSCRRSWGRSFRSFSTCVEQCEIDLAGNRPN